MPGLTWVSRTVCRVPERRDSSLCSIARSQPVFVSTSIVLAAELQRSGIMAAGYVRITPKLTLRHFDPKVRFTVSRIRITLTTVET